MVLVEEEEDTEEGAEEEAEAGREMTEIEMCVTETGTDSRFRFVLPAYYSSLLFVLNICKLN